MLGHAIIIASDIIDETIISEAIFVAVSAAGKTSRFVVLDPNDGVGHAHRGITMRDQYNGNALPGAIRSIVSLQVFGSKF